MSELDYFSGRFENQIAVITGGVGGIGKEIALRMGREGATIILFDYNSDRLSDTQQEFVEIGLSIFIYNIDISDEGQVLGAFEEVYLKHGKIDVLIHSAGIVGATNTKIEDFNFNEFEKVCRINLFGSFLVTKYAIQKMQLNSYGRILLIASIAGKEGNPGMVGYSASKAGMLGLIKGVAKEYAESGITINGLAPAVVKTAMNADTDPKQLEYMTAKIPMKRLGTPKEVAAISCYIVSKENSFSTGFIYDVSGGRATY